MGAVKSKIKQLLNITPKYKNVNSANITTDPGRSFDEMFANLRTFGIDPEHPSPEDLDNLDWLREVREDKDAAVIQADKARWTAQAEALKKQVKKKAKELKPKKYKDKVPLSPAEEVLRAERRGAREQRNLARTRRKDLQKSRQLVPLH